MLILSEGVNILAGLMISLLFFIFNILDSLKKVFLIHQGIDTEILHVDTVARISGFSSRVPLLRRGGDS